MSSNPSPDPVPSLSADCERCGGEGRYMPPGGRRQTDVRECPCSLSAEAMSEAVEAAEEAMRAEYLGIDLRRQLVEAREALRGLKDSAEPFHRLDLDLGDSPVRPDEWASVCEPLREALVAAGSVLAHLEEGGA